MGYGDNAPYGELSYKGEASESLLLTAPVHEEPADEETEMVVIPFTDYPKFSQNVILDKALYVFRFVWNERGRYWTATVLDISGEVVISGVKVMINYEMFSRFSISNLPKGFVLPIDEKGSFARIEDGDMGNRVNLLYIPEAELAAL